MNMRNICFAIKSIAMGIFMAMLFACSNKLSDVYDNPEEAALPDIQYHNATFQQTDSGFLKAKIVAPIANQYLGDSGKIVFPERFTVYFYNDIGVANAELKANYGEQESNQDVLKAEGNVILSNYEDSSYLYTEELIYNQKSKRIFAPVPIRITNPDQIIFGDSLDANADLSDKEIFGFRGEFEMKEQDTDSISK